MLPGFYLTRKSWHPNMPCDGSSVGADLLYTCIVPHVPGYRLRILRVNDLPLHTTFDGRTFEFQLGVSLYDEAYGTFYGNTVYRCVC